MAYNVSIRAESEAPINLIKNLMCSETPHCKNKDSVSNNLPRIQFYLHWDQFFEAS